MADALGMMERDAVDLETMKFIDACGISFNVLHSPYFANISAVNRAPKRYKAFSSEKGRTTLLDACQRSVEHDLGAVKDTWYTNGISIVSNGWTNIINKPLISVIASKKPWFMLLICRRLFWS